MLNDCLIFLKYLFAHSFYKKNVFMPAVLWQHASKCWIQVMNWLLEVECHGSGCRSGSIHLKYKGVYIYIILWLLPAQFDSTHGQHTHTWLQVSWCVPVNSIWTRDNVSQKFTGTISIHNYAWSWVLTLKEAESLSSEDYGQETPQRLVVLIDLPPSDVEKRTLTLLYRMSSIQYICTCSLIPCSTMWMKKMVMVSW